MSKKKLLWTKCYPKTKLKLTGKKLQKKKLLNGNDYDKRNFFMASGIVIS